MTQPSTNDNLVRVASYVNVAQADLACARLAMDGIPARLDNGVFLLWCWHFSNAAGGVRVFVAQRDVHRARAVLFLRGTPPQWQPPPWACPKCRAEVDGMWQVCWACGTAKDGTEDPAFFHEPAHTQGLNQDSSDCSAGLLTGVFLVLFLLTGFAAAVFVAWLATMVCLGLRQTMQQACGGEPTAEFVVEAESPATGPSLPPADAESEGDAKALRAWQASVIAFFSVPPLAIYAIWLLDRLAAAKAPLRPASRWRVRGAWVFGLLAMPMCLVWLTLLAWLPYYAVEIAASVFNVSGMKMGPP